VQRLSGASLLVFKNKSDVPGAMTEDEVREVCDTELERRAGWRANGNADGEQGLRLEAIRTHKWHMMTCSAMAGTNLQEGLEWVVQDAKARLFLY
jgi:ADP-ribosylation factor-like protein 2